MAFITSVALSTQVQCACVSHRSPLRMRPTSTFLSNSRCSPLRYESNARSSVQHVTAALEPLILSEENVNLALEEVKVKLGSLFGNSAENQNVGITGDVELASLDGPIVVLRLKGRFWHQRSDVLARVSSYLMERIPEICDTEIEDIQQLENSEEESARLS